MYRLSDYEVDGERGFLPAPDPLDRLPNDSSYSWEKLGRELPKLLMSGKVRSFIKDMPLLDATRLRDDRERRRAMVILSFLGSLATSHCCKIFLGVKMKSGLLWFTSRSRRKRGRRSPRSLRLSERSLTINRKSLRASWRPSPGRSKRCMRSYCACPNGAIRTSTFAG